MNQLLTKIKITTVLYTVSHVFEKKQELLMYSTVFICCMHTSTCMYVYTYTQQLTVDTLHYFGHFLNM